MPPSLRHLFNGKRNLVRSLNTKILAQAKLQRDDAVAALKKMLRDAKAANPENAGAVVREAQLKALQDKWQKKIQHTGVFGAASPLSAKDKAEYQADVALARALGSLKIAESLGVPTFEKAKTPLNHLEEEWFEAAKLTNRTKIHYRHCRELLTAHLRREGLPEQIESVDSKVALSYRKYLVAQKTHTTTGNSYLGGLRSRWAMLIEEEIINPPNPFTGISLKASRLGKEAGRLPYSTGELVTLFTGDPGQSLFNVMTLALCGGGLRRGEIVPRLVRDVEGDWLIVRYGKGQSSVRRVFIASILRPGIARLVKGKAPDDFLVDFRGTTIEAKKNNVTEDMTAYLRNVAKITDEKKDGLHVYRHVWEHTALEQGIEWHVTQAVMGHAPSSGHAVTAGYAHLSLLDAPKREAIEAVVKALPRPVIAVIRSRFGKP